MPRRNGSSRAMCRCVRRARSCCSILIASSLTSLSVVLLNSRLSSGVTLPAKRSKAFWRVWRAWSEGGPAIGTCRRNAETLRQHLFKHEAPRRNGLVERWTIIYSAPQADRRCLQPCRNIACAPPQRVCGHWSAFPAPKVLQGVGR